MTWAASLPRHRRAAYALAAYVLYALVTTALVPLIYTYTQAHGISAIYELAPDESPGPLGSMDLIMYVFGLHYAFFLLLVLPVFLILEGPWWLFVLLLTLNEPFMLGMWPAALYLTGHKV